MTLPNVSATPPATPGAANGGPGLSPFHIVALVFQRARQLKNGARPRVDAGDHRPTRVALLEVLADTVSWSVAPKAEPGAAPPAS